MNQNSNIPRKIQLQARAYEVRKLLEYLDSEIEKESNTEFVNNIVTRLSPQPQTQPQTQQVEESIPSPFTPKQEGSDGSEGGVKVVAE